MSHRAQGLAYLVSGSLCLAGAALVVVGRWVGPCWALDAGLGVGALGALVWAGATRAWTRGP